MKSLPALLAGEQQARQTYDPQRIAEQQGLQAQFGPTQYNQQLAALQQLDPQGVAIRQQLGQATASDLASGYNLPPAFAEQLNSQIRGAETVRGNVAGAAPISAEAIYKGQNAVNLYQQHLQNAGAFLAGPTPEQQLLSVQPVTPDRASAYVNPSAPGQLAAPNYQNMLAQYAASGGGRNPWAGALGGAVGGATAGASFGPYGAAGGAVIGAVGGYFSDARKKNHIEYVGRSPKGHPIYEFCYDDVPDQRFRGTVAQELLATCPEACTLGADGWWRVDYSKTDIKLEQIPAEVYA